MLQQDEQMHTSILASTDGESFRIDKSCLRHLGKPPNLQSRHRHSPCCGTFQRAWLRFDKPGGYHMPASGAACSALSSRTFAWVRQAGRLSYTNKPRSCRFAATDSSLSSMQSNRSPGYACRKKLWFSDLIWWYIVPPIFQSRQRNEYIHE
ncbi:hypothetical protein BO86DRAFT_243413 [Aspergillus japonicus CBS 114.51]|uniref:Uncharacterized protein n=2 Tax=Aspergillus TaxID=5052 RepID=A0A2V5HHS0_ASPV1|nr:hypothetical protein BO86DRAFT_243413 [Aspergillus japonicus CBS 114.51]PYI21404.1 hypothetical protein BO99DRAFT_76568 [Aspergillus violaceofuscus CBS 115571]RAH84443.1 hypothetical protein BO86DRAFT_243413 [Aspergillus japonicus CBS 114.51]